MHTETAGQGSVIVERFATGRMPPTARLNYWNDIANQTFTGMVIDAASPQSFSAKLERINFGTLSLAEATADASVVSHTREHARRDQANPFFLLHLQLSGESVNSQAGNDTELVSGDFAVCDTTRPYRLSFTRPATFLVVRLPADEFRRRLPLADDAAGLRVSGRSSRTALLRSFLQSLRAQAMLPDNEDWEGLTSVCAEFAAMCIQPWIDTADARNHRTERQVMEAVRENFRTPGFGVNDVAREVGISARNVQKIFATRGTTPSLYILRQRLKEAARILEQTDDSITEIAMNLGFNDLTYFARSFRNVFGKSPGQYKKSFRH